MSIEIRLPDLSPTITEADLVKWHVQEGDAVSAGDIIAEIETDKAAVDIEAPAAGIVAQIVIREGTLAVAVGTVIAILDPDAPVIPDTSDAAENTRSTPAARGLADPATRPAPALAASNAQPEMTVQAETPPSGLLSTSALSESANITPLARRMAAQAGLDLTQVHGSSPDGRITRIDVESAASGKTTPPNIQPKTETAFEPPFDLQPLSRMRKTIARRLTHSKQQIPHFYLSVDCNVDALFALLKKTNDELADEPRLSLNDVVIKTAAAALGQVPAANASWSDEGIKLYRSVDISVAVAVEGGLITPVIRNANRKGLRVISAEMKELAAKARGGELRPDEYRGGTFSISNLGMYGIRQFDAVIDPPQACMLAIGAADERPVVRDGLVVTSTVMTCTLSADHRVLDGAVAAEFLTAFRQHVEEPVTTLFE